MAYLGKKILIVEDDKPLLTSLKEKFKEEGFKVFSAEDGQEGFSIAVSEKPDIILIDILLPKMDGISMAKKIKEAGVIPPMIFLTNLDDIGHITEAFGAANDFDYLVKVNWNIDEVVDRVKKRLNLKK